MISTVYLLAVLIAVQTILAAPTALLPRSEIKVASSTGKEVEISSKCSGGLVGYGNYGNYGNYVNGYDGYGYNSYDSYDNYDAYNTYNTYNSYSGTTWRITSSGAVYCPFTSDLYYQTINNYLGNGLCNNYASNYVFGPCGARESCPTTYNAFTVSLTAAGGYSPYGLTQLSDQHLKADSKQV